MAGGIGEIGGRKGTVEKGRKACRNGDVGGGVGSVVGMGMCGRGVGSVVGMGMCGRGVGSVEGMRRIRDRVARDNAVEIAKFLCLLPFHTTNERRYTTG
jgi:hypothetical protein